MQGALLKGPLDHRGIGVLLEGNDSVSTKLPNMGKWSPKTLARGFVRSAVFAKRNHCARIFNILLWNHRIAVPLGTKFHEDILKHVVSPYIRAPVGKAFGLLPGYVGSEAASTVGTSPRANAA